MNVDATDAGTKHKALAALVVALVITVAAWVFINKATESGLARLELIDRVYAVCNADYARARTAADTSRIDAQPLSAVIDSGTTSAPRRCGDMRRPADALAAQDSARRAQAVRSMMPTRDGR